MGREKLDNDDRNHRNQVLEHLRRFESESPDLRERRLRLEAEDTRKENDTIDDAFRLYDFRLGGRERFGGYDAVLLTFVPTPGLEPRTNEGKLLKNFSGRAWIAEQDCQLIRVELESIGEVSMGFGVLARFYKGSRVVFQRRRVSDAVWLPSELSYSVDGRVLLVKKLRVQGMSAIEITVCLSSARTPARARRPCGGRRLARYVRTRLGIRCGTGNRR